MTEGQELVIHHGDRAFAFTVVELRPENSLRAACLTNADVTLDLDAPPSSPGQGEEGAVGAAAAVAPGGVASSAATAAATAAGGLVFGSAASAAGATVAGGRSTTQQLQHRPLELGDAVTEDLRTLGAVALFTVLIRLPARGVRLTLTSSLAPGASGPAEESAQLAGRGGAGSGAGGHLLGSAAGIRGAAALLPAPGALPPALGVSRSPVLTAADVSLQFLAGAGAGGPGGMASHAAPVAAAPLTACSGHAEADLWVSPLVSRPSRWAHTWAQTDVAADKTITILPDDPALPPPNELATVALYVAITGYGAAPLAFTLRADALAAPLTGARAGDGGGATLPGEAAAAATTAGVAGVAGAVPPTPPVPGTRPCATCGQAILERTYDVHSSFCARNNWRCARCGVVTQKAAAAAHVHCGVCNALCAGAAGVAKHHNLVHEPWPCDLGCGQRVAPRHYAEHARTECPCRRVSCVYCTIALSFRERAEHEAMCGGRTAPCDVCGKLEARKRMARHLALQHGMGDVAAHSALTPSSPYLRGGGDALAGMGDFDLGAAAGGGNAFASSALNAESVVRRGGGEAAALRFEDLIDTGDDDEDEDADYDGDGGAAGARVIGELGKRRWAEDDAVVFCPSCQAPCATWDDMQVGQSAEVPAHFPVPAESLPLQYRRFTC